MLGLHRPGVVRLLCETVPVNRILPAPTDNTAFIEDVAREGLEAVSGRHTRSTLDLPACDHFAVVLVDGLGSHNLHARSGYARHLLQADRQHPHRPLSARLPTTTAASLTSLATGLAPAQHGIVGYSVYDRDARTVRNQLNGWGPEMPPESWQPHSTLFEQASGVDVEAFAIGPADYEHSGFSAATLRGARYVAADDLEDRFAALADIRRHAKRSLVQVYVPELDKIGHRRGWGSPRWSEMLEQIDAVTADARLERRGWSTVLTGDHGMLDIDGADHVLLTEWSGSESILATAGEPRCVQLVLTDEADHPAAALDLQRHLDDVAGTGEFVTCTRAELCDSGLLGPSVDATARHRLGDVAAIALGDHAAIYRGLPADEASRRMVGQHGGFSRWEREVPLIRW
ncbi:alkaline phosphatase family protein [Pseudoclavibacter sp. CFCC 14310]|nr:alkaline phosphatase family protein [Pseudoclavibacter sp. CFCC 14310]